MCCLCSESLCFAVHWTFSTSCHRAQHRSLYPRSSRAAPLTWPNGTVHQELSKAEGLAASQTLDASGKDVSLDNSSRPGVCPQDVNTPHCSALNLSILASQSVLSSSHSPSLQYLSAGNDLLFVPMETHWVPAGITYSVIIFTSKFLYRIHDTLPASLSPPWSSFFLSSFLSPFLPFFPLQITSFQAPQAFSLCIHWNGFKYNHCVPHLRPGDITPRPSIAVRSAPEYHLVKRSVNSFYFHTEN